MCKTQRLSIDQKILGQIAKNYSTLDYKAKLVKLLNTIDPNKDYSSIAKYQLQTQINDLIVNNYSGEQVAKYKLFNLFYSENVVAAFEIKVNKSRLDFLKIGDYSFSFEIKSELDNLYKLPNQVSNYQKAFDFNCIVIDEKHLQNTLRIVPSSFGIWSLTNSAYPKVHRHPTLNLNVDPEFQLRMLTKKEMNKHFGNQEGDVKNIIRELNADEINIEFKKALKRRYYRRWAFITSKQASILPIDVQFFFNCNIDPETIYFM